MDKSELKSRIERLKTCIDMHCIGGEIVRAGMRDDLAYVIQFQDREEYETERQALFAGCKYFGCPTQSVLEFYWKEYQKDYTKEQLEPKAEGEK